MRAGKPLSLSSGIQGSGTCKRSPAPEVTDQEVAAITEAPVLLPPLSSESYPSLDLMANWTGGPSMAQVLDGLSADEAIEEDRQIDDIVNNWRSDYGTN